MSKNVFIVNQKVKPFSLGFFSRLIVDVAEVQTHFSALGFSQPNVCVRSFRSRGNLIFVNWFMSLSHTINIIQMFLNYWDF